MLWKTMKYISIYLRLIYLCWPTIPTIFCLPQPWFLQYKHRLVKTFQSFRATEQSCIGLSDRIIWVLLKGHKEERKKNRIKESSKGSMTKGTNEGKQERKIKEGRKERKWKEGRKEERKKDLKQYSHVHSILGHKLLFVINTSNCTVHL